MIEMKELGEFLAKTSCPFFVGSLVSNKILFVNKSAQKMFGCTEETCRMEDIFEKSSDRVQAVLANVVASGETVLLYNHQVVRADGEKIPADLQIGFMNEEKTQVFMEIIPQKDLRMKMAIHQIDNAPRAEAILNMDETLSIVHCNKDFYHVLKCNDILREKYYHNDFIEAIIPKEREDLMKRIAETLSTEEMFKEKIQVRNCYGVEKWYDLQMVKRYLDNSRHVFLLISLKDIENQVQIEEKFSLMQQYMEAMQESTVDILYRVDVKSGTMYLPSNFSLQGIPQVMPNYVKTFLESNIIHPDDKSVYLDNLGKFNRGEPAERPIRFSLSGQEYQWYKITGKKIYDSFGEVTEVFGTLVNVQKEEDMKVVVAETNKYLKVMQEFHDGILYRIDVATRTLYYTIKSESGEIETVKIEDYVNEAVNNGLIHPSSVKKFREIEEQWLEGNISEVQYRMKLNTPDYQWYSDIAYPIYDDDGVMVQLYGRLENIDKEISAEGKASTLNQYFQAVQYLSDDVVFLIDVETMTLRSSFNQHSSLGIPEIVPNFIQTFLENHYIHPDDQDIFRIYSSKLMNGEAVDFEVRLLFGVDYYESCRVKTSYISSGFCNPAEIIGTIKSIQREKDLEARASRDYLTKVHNREAFQSKVNKLFKVAKTGESHALVFIDMDNFKYVNDNFGHQFGDFILEKFAQRVNNCIRETDFLGRIGGDEFILFLKNVRSHENALERAETILERLSKPITNSEFSHKIGASIGVSVYPDHGKSYDDLYHRADKAVYASKEGGKNLATLYHWGLEKA